jgi:hypothetical protein
MSDTRPMTPEQAATLKQLAKVAYELDAFKPNLLLSAASRGQFHRHRCRVLVLQNLRPHL